MGTGTDGPTAILSIDGGGIRGLIPARLIAEIEQRADRPAHELFDLIAGTSTGGLLALGLAIPAPERDEPATARELADLYVEQGSRIFSAPLSHRIAGLGGLTEPRYPQDPIEDVLRERFGNRRLREARTEVIVPAYDLESREPYFFKSREASKTAERDCPAWKAARSATAAPTYFAPEPVASGEREQPRVLVDGGVVANNPAMCAYAEALAHDDHARDVQLVSLGTGTRQRSIAQAEAEDWGLAGWAPRILDVVFDGDGDAIDYQLDHVLNDREHRYHRLQPELVGDEDWPAPSEALDEAGEANVEALDALAEDFVDSNQHRIDEIVEAVEPTA